MPNSVDVYLFRHSQSEANLTPHIVGGRSNHSPLSELGVLQSQELGLYIADNIDSPDLVFASPAVRTVSTAGIALESAGIQRHIFIDDRLQELHQGEAEGKNRESIYTPELFARIEREGMDFKHKGGQSLNELGKQGVDWLDETYEQTLRDYGVIYVFGHGMAIRSLVGRILGWDHLQIFQAKTPNTCMTKISGSPRTWSVELFAQNTHNSVLTN